jgi:hypothetical protein
MRSWQSGALVVTCGCVGVGLWASPAVAQTRASALPPHRPAVVSFLAAVEGLVPTSPIQAPRRLTGVTFQTPVAAQAPADQGAPPPPRPRAFVYSDAYRTRAKIHKLASFATLPLFTAEAIVGQSLYQNPTPGKRSAHLAIAAGMGVLFAVNTVTGVWNLIEARKDPRGRTRRLLHAVLLLAADGGFLATAATAPDSEFGRGGAVRGQSGGTRSLHRALAFTSIGLASAGYLVMLIGGR